MNQIVREPSAAFAGPVTPQSPALRQLLETIAAGASQRDRERILPHDAIDLARRSRLGALRLPVAAGGAGASNRELYEMVIALGAADSNVAHILRNHFVFVERLLTDPEDPQHRKWLKLVAGGAIFGLASGELDIKKAGTGDLSTTLTPDGDGFRLNGTKYYSTGSLYSDYILVRAVTPEGKTASAVIPADREGLNLLDDWDGLGQRLTGTGTTILENARVEAEEVALDVDGATFRLPYANTVPQIFLTAVNAGILRAILRDATALIHSRSRTYYHAPTEKAAEDPILQQTVGTIASYAFAAEATVLAAADALDRLIAARGRGEPEPTAAQAASLLAAKAKVVVDELAIKAGSLLFDVGGASSTKQLHNLDRHWRNARTLSSHNPTTYKARVIGDHEINGTALPIGGFF